MGGPGHGLTLPVSQPTATLGTTAFTKTVVIMTVEELSVSIDIFTLMSRSVNDA
jgi:hypothetical protein